MDEQNGNQVNFPLGIIQLLDQGKYRAADLASVTEVNEAGLFLENLKKLDSALNSFPAASDKLHPDEEGLPDYYHPVQAELHVDHPIMDAAYK